MLSYFLVLVRLTREWYLSSMWTYYTCQTIMIFPYGFSNNWKRNKMNIIGNLDIFFLLSHPVWTNCDFSDCHNVCLDLHNYRYSKIMICILWYILMSFKRNNVLLHTISKSQFAPHVHKDIQMPILNCHF